MYQFFFGIMNLLRNEDSGGAKMSKGDNRLKILYVLDELKENSKQKTDKEEDRFLSANYLIGVLSDKYDLSADRKSVYNYIESLIKYGYDIEKSRRGYYLKEHYRVDEEELELAELKMIVDALSASRFISAKKTKGIIKKLRLLTDSDGEYLLNRQLYHEKAIKSNNSSVIYSIDAIYSAITENRKISFKYQKIVVDYGLSGGMLVSENRQGDDHKDKIYVQSPYALVWKNEYYYLICFDSVSNSSKTFRVDRMKDVTILEGEKRDGGRFFEEINITEYANTAFSMYGGETIEIVLRVKNELASVIADRFGTDIGVYHDEDENYFRCSVKVQKSRQFFSWLSGFGGDLTLVYPEELKKDYVAYLQNVLKHYDI